MTKTRPDLLKLKRQHELFSTLAEASSREELIKCSKILAMYIALYRKQFGEIPLNCTKQINTAAADEDLLQITIEGLYEAGEMLKAVRSENGDNSQFTTGHSNFIN